MHQFSGFSPRRFGVEILRQGGGKEWVGRGSAFCRSREAV